jgi:hypothetical protein
MVADGAFVGYRVIGDADDGGEVTAGGCARCDEWRGGNAEINGVGSEVANGGFDVVGLGGKGSSAGQPVVHTRDGPTVVGQCSKSRIRAVARSPCTAVNPHDYSFGLSLRQVKIEGESLFADGRKNDVGFDDGSV